MPLQNYSPSELSREYVVDAVRSLITSGPAWRSYVEAISKDGRPEVASAVAGFSVAAKRVFAADPSLKAAVIRSDALVGEAIDSVFAVTKRLTRAQMQQLPEDPVSDLMHSVVRFGVAIGSDAQLSTSGDIPKWSIRAAQIMELFPHLIEPPRADQDPSFGRLVSSAGGTARSFGYLTGNDPDNRDAYLKELGRQLAVLNVNGGKFGGNQLDAFCFVRNAVRLSPELIVEAIGHYENRPLAKSLHMAARTFDRTLGRAIRENELLGQSLDSVINEGRRPATLLTDHPHGEHNDFLDDLDAALTVFEQLPLDFNAAYVSSLRRFARAYIEQNPFDDAYLKTTIRQRAKRWNDFASTQTAGAFGLRGEAFEEAVGALGAAFSSKAAIKAATDAGGRLDAYVEFVEKTLDEHLKALNESPIAVFSDFIYKRDVDVFALYHLAAVDLDDTVGAKALIERLDAVRSNYPEIEAAVDNVRFPKPTEWQRQLYVVQTAEADKWPKDALDVEVDKLTGWMQANELQVLELLDVTEEPPLVEYPASEEQVRARGRLNDISSRFEAVSEALRLIEDNAEHTLINAIDEVHDAIDSGQAPAVSAHHLIRLLEDRPAGTARFLALTDDIEHNGQRVPDFQRFLRAKLDAISNIRTISESLNRMRDPLGADWRTRAQELASALRTTPDNTYRQTVDLRKALGQEYENVLRSIVMFESHGRPSGTPGGQRDIRAALVLKNVAGKVPEIQRFIDAALTPDRALIYQQHHAEITRGAASKSNLTSNAVEDLANDRTAREVLYRLALLSRVSADVGSPEVAATSSEKLRAAIAADPTAVRLTHMMASKLDVRTESDMNRQTFAARLDDALDGAAIDDPVIALQLANARELRPTTIEDQLAVYQVARDQGRTSSQAVIGSEIADRIRSDRPTALRLLHGDGSLLRTLQELDQPAINAAIEAAQDPAHAHRRRDLPIGRQPEPQPERPPRADFGMTF